MTTSHITIKCPECGHEFDISDVLYDQVEHDLKKQYDAQLKEAQDKFRKESQELEKQRADLAKAQDEQQEAVNQAIREGLRKERQSLTEKIAAEIREEESGRVKELQDEVRKKSEQVKELHKAEAEIERLKREKDEAQSKAEADAARKLNEMLVTEREKIQKDEEERQTLKIREKDHLIQQLNDRLKEAQRKAEQGSMQLQGEVQELAIEEWLAAAYPLDTIEEIKERHTREERQHRGAGHRDHASRHATNGATRWHLDLHLCRPRQSVGRSARLADRDSPGSGRSGKPR
jgi:hypothetical protein